MSHSASHPARTVDRPQPSPPVSRLSFTAAFSALAAILLIVPEIWLLAVATIWATDGLLGLSITGDLVIAAIIVPPSLWATWMTVKLAIAAERNPDQIT